MKRYKVYFSSPYAGSLEINAESAQDAAIDARYEWHPIEGGIEYDIKDFKVSEVKEIEVEGEFDFQESGEHWIVVRNLTQEIYAKCLQRIHAREVTRALNELYKREQVNE